MQNPGIEIEVVDYEKNSVKLTYTKRNQMLLMQSYLQGYRDRGVIMEATNSGDYRLRWLQEYNREVERGGLKCENLF